MCESCRPPVTDASMANAMVAALRLTLAVVDGGTETMTVPTAAVARAFPEVLLGVLRANAELSGVCDEAAQTDWAREQLVDLIEYASLRGWQAAMDGPADTEGRPQPE